MEDDLWHGSHRVAVKRRMNGHARKESDRSKINETERVDAVKEYM